MKDAGLWKERRDRSPRVFQMREPRQRLGELVQVDGSYHKWFEKRGPETCLLVFIDDATSRIMHLSFVQQETSFNYMFALKQYIHQHGAPEALFSDRFTVFRSAKPDKHGEYRPTQFSTACASLGIQVICAKTPQAKGRVERVNRTLQDRLIKELRLRNIGTIQEATTYLPEYIAAHNARFARPPALPNNAHRALPEGQTDNLLVFTSPRKVFKDLSVSYNRMKLIIDPSRENQNIIGKFVLVVVNLQGKIRIFDDEREVDFRIFDRIRRIGEAPVVQAKRLDAALALGKIIQEQQPHHFQRPKVLPVSNREFQHPDDPTSVRLRNAPDEVRKQYRRRPRPILHTIPILVCKDEFAKHMAEFDNNSSSDI